MLSWNWITDKTLDVEYKKYTLLAYLQKVDSGFKDNKLFPSYPEVNKHHKNLLNLRQTKLRLSGKFPKEMVGINWKKARIKYKTKFDENAWLQKVEEIAVFALPLLKQRQTQGAEILELAKESVKVEPLGIIPLYKQEGYIILPQQNKQTTHVFQYKISTIQSENEEETTVYTTDIHTWTSSITQSDSTIQQTLRKLNPKLPLPATWLAETTTDLPLKETFLPVVKRILCKRILGS